MSDLNSGIEHFISQVKDLKVCVVGETIIDEFIEVKYEGQSMKSFCPVFRYAGENGPCQKQMGGAAAIASHLEDFVAQVDLLSNKKGEIVKTRLIDQDNHKKHVELNKFETHNFGQVKPSGDYDVVIIADFGHGFCDQLEVAGKYHFMTQTNSNNFGYNRMSKWKDQAKKSACMDLREANLQVNLKTDFSQEGEIPGLFNYELGAEKLFLTLGKRGAVYYDGNKYAHQPVFEAPVKDTIGAGDTFYAFAALASELNFDDVKENLIVPSLAASLSCTWLCNEEAVTKEKLRAHAARFIS
jgi:bifunctional ADP-heptose synthase (sugar kinase/adenylyltransferase)